MANSKINKMNIDNENEFLKLTKLVIIITVIFLSFYLITYFVNKKEKVEDKQINHIQFKEILIGNLLEQNEKEYYVLLTDLNDNNYNLYNTYISEYSKKEKSLNYYTSEINNPLNNVFKSDKDNLKVDKIKDFRISRTSLLKIKNGKIVESYQANQLKDYLKKISK